MSNDNGVTSAVEYRDQSTKVVTHPGSGRSVRIRKLMPFDLIPAGLLETTSGSALPQVAARIKDQVNKIDPLEEFRIVLLKGIIEPKPVDKPWDEVNWEAGEVQLSSFGWEVGQYFADQIIEFSEIGGVAAKEAAGFSEEQESGGTTASDVQRLRGDVAVPGDEVSDTG